MNFIIKPLLVFIFCFSIAFANSQSSETILTIEEEKVSLEDFESIFRKNNRDSAITKESLDEYIELFINFKLKVQEAKSLGLDTNASFIQELSGYRKQLSRPYLTDSDLLDDLVNEAYDRKSQEVKASHILVNCSPNATPEDTLKAYKRIVNLRNRVIGGEDFTTVAKGNGGSDDPSVKDNGGDLGYFTVFQMVYPFEEAAYNTQVGEVSQPVRTRFGYHILKVSDKREARGEIKVAHIMVRSLEKDNMKVEQKIIDRINEIYKELKDGKDFAEMALKYSDDASTSRKGGELPWFGTGKMVEEFENVAFTLNADNNISAPFDTKYGWHIIKWMDYRPVASFDEVKKELKSKVSRDTRADQTKDSFIAKLKEEYNFTHNAKTLKPILSAVDTNLFNGVIDIKKMSKLEKELFSFAGKSYSGLDFYNYLLKGKYKKRDKSPKQEVNDKLNKYMDNEVLRYEDSQLENKHDAFRLLMNEYRDGILLFELTDEKVWSRAVKDTVGLEAYYESNKKNFMWERRADATVYSCKDDIVAKMVRKNLKKGKSADDILSLLNKDSQLNLSIKNGVYTSEDHDALSKLDWQIGLSENTSINGEVVFVDFKEIIEPAPKKLDEAKGMITASYQNYLEEQWIQELRNKYKYTVNTEVLHSLAR